MTMSTSLRSRLGWTLDGILLVVASGVTFLPSARHPESKYAVFALWTLHGGLGIHTAWKAGLLAKTPGQLYRTIRVSGPPKRRRFEDLAFFMGLVGCVVASWL